ncbi:hypothetical protein AMAG_14431 [Allomyces macrogynus ATCC 38327]|uniref:Homeobox domain-containing protein n=1 Tax=Allomyces macrogynus (strain ATCC 38327) TaxID=578462 RepID=A0A0L0T6A7_ALLM3|nr:hypothetical protein AMAG_14431 [Allomyces macrogynus ATCC 38327]|eukprot:KNE70285.1 hypothetical protein AMAG_14431 [Allomyces macrogynus ATCC 38327]
MVPRGSADRTQYEDAPRHPPAPPPPTTTTVHKLTTTAAREMNTTTVHEPTADVTAPRGSTASARPNAGRHDPTSIPSPPAAMARGRDYTSASASVTVASLPHAVPARRVHEGGGPSRTTSNSGPSSPKASGDGGVTSGGAATATRRSAPDMDTDRALLAVVKTRQRRGQLPADARATLLAWVDGHRESPYPTRAEKDQLMAATGLTLSQVENFFVNFRRRSLKKTSTPHAPTHPHRTGEPMAPAPPMGAPSALDVHAHALRSARPLAGRGDHDQCAPLLPPSPRHGS